MCVRLSSDGIHFAIVRGADPAQHPTPDDLALLLDRANGQPPEAASPTGPKWEEEETRSMRFLRQLAADDAPATVSATRKLRTHWEKLGGSGTAPARSPPVRSSCWVSQERRAAHLAAAALRRQRARRHSGGRVRPHGEPQPFTDRALRAELLNRVNGMEGVSLSEGKLKLRPGFRLSVLQDESNTERLFAALAWFPDCWARRD